MASECGTGKIYPAPNPFVALVVCDEHQIEVLQFAVGGLALLFRVEC